MNASTRENNRQINNKYGEKGKCVGCTKGGESCVDVVSVVPVQSKFSIAVRCVRLENTGH